jgi:hypothetical protein
MTASIVNDLLELMPDTLTATPGHLDGYGKFVASGAVLALPCYISGKTRLVRDLTGQEVVSSMKVTVGGVNDLTVEGHRYTLPTRFNPRVDLRAILVKKVSDEDGPHHEVVMFP